MEVEELYRIIYLIEEFGTLLAAFTASMEKHQYQYLAEYFLAFLPEDVLHTPSLFWAG